MVRRDALTVNGGTFGASGLTYDVNNTQAATTTTIDGGGDADTFNLSSTAENLWAGRPGRDQWQRRGRSDAQRPERSRRTTL